MPSLIFEESCASYDWFRFGSYMLFSSPVNSIFSLDKATTLE